MEIIRKHFETIDSTNTWVKHNAHHLDRSQITLVTAGNQTAGRGRFNRRWESPDKVNIYATFGFFVEKHRIDIGNIPQILSLSALHTLEGFGFASKLKWPNDVLVSEKKIAGILCETTPLSDLLCVALGIGLNVNMPLDVLVRIDRPATSMAVEGGKPFEVETVLQALSTHFKKDLELFLEEGFYPFLEEYKSKMWIPKEKRIRFHDNRTVWEGVFHSINNDGSLNLQLDNGEVKRFIAGEILY